MGYNGPEIITRFVKYAGKYEYGTEPDGKNGRDRQRFPNGKGSSLFYATDHKRRVVELQSYGSHFPLAHLLLTKSGKRKMWLLNGDRWPGGGFGRANEHNDIARAAAQASGTPWFIVPFSACREAGIETTTIKPVHVDPERWETEHHSAATLAEVPEGYRKNRMYRVSGRVIEPPRNEEGREASPNYGGENTWTVGERKLTDRGLEWTWTEIPGPAYTPDTLAVEYEEIEPGEDGLYHWETSRHWLGASLFRARYFYSGRVGRNRKYVSGHRWAYFVTAFDYNEPGPLWFMSELPRGVHPKTVDEAIEALKPWQVESAERRGVPVIRQGDVFVIQRPGFTEKNLIAAGGELVEHVSIEGAWHRPGLYGRYINDSHTATRVIRLPGGVTYVRGILRHHPENRRPDHAARELWDRKTWGLVELNTQARSFDNTPRSWSLAGDVD